MQRVWWEGLQEGWVGKASFEKGQWPLKGQVQRESFGRGQLKGLNQWTEGD